MISETSNLKFYNPFQGKKKKVRFSSIFLPELDFFMKLSGKPLRELMIEAGEESLYKRMHRVYSEKYAIKLLSEIYIKFKPSGKVGGALKLIIDKGRFDRKSKAPGVYETYFEGLYKKDEERSYPSKFLIEIEKQTGQASDLIFEGNIKRGVNVLLNQPICKHILWPEAEDILKNVEKVDSINFISIAVSFEVLLAILAARDVQLSLEGNYDFSIFECVLPTKKTGNKNPTSLLFEVVKNEIGVDSIPEFMDTIGINEHDFDVSFFKRWSAGNPLPSVNSFNSILSNKRINEETRALMRWRYFAVKVLSFIGYAYQDIVKNIELNKLTIQEKELISPFPNLPFGYSSIQSWLETRYPYWINYHKNEICRKG